MQVALAEGESEEISSLASESLRAVDPAGLARQIEEGLGDSALSWLGRNVDHPVVVEAVVRRKDVPRSLLEHLAPTLSESMQEVLLLRQDAIIELPAILDALETNPELSSYSSRRVAEYRRHLLRAERRLEDGTAAPEAEEETTDLEVAEAIYQARSQPASGEVDEITGLSESQLRTLPLPVRLKLSRRAPRALRSILVRDSNPSVAVSVLENNEMSEAEIEQIARSRTVSEDVLRLISKNRSWVRKYPIAVALVKNPRSPTGVAIQLASRLSVRDLRSIGRDRNVAHSVRSACERLYKLKLS